MIGTAVVAVGGLIKGGPAALIVMAACVTAIALMVAAVVLIVAFKMKVLPEFSHLRWRAIASIIESASDEVVQLPDEEQRQGGAEGSMTRARRARAAP